MGCRKPRKPYQTMNRFNLPIKTTTKEGKREYMRLYMKNLRLTMKAPNIADVIGLKRKRR